MSDSLAVVVGEILAGTVERLGDARLRFVYDDGYRSRPDATPLSLSMPLRIDSHPDRTISPWLWGLLPDNDLVRGCWARQFHVSASSAFSLLSTPIGEDCAGAVRFARPDALAQMLERPGGVTWLSGNEVAQRLRDLREDSTSWLGRTFTGQFSLAGAQAKTALLYEDQRWGVPSGATPTTHILKPAVAGLDDHDLNEHLCLDAARRLGLVAVRTRVQRFGSESAVVVDRYDRRIEDGSVLRVHQEDICQALSVPPSHKYQNEGGPSPGDIAALFRRVMPAPVANDSIRRFADALIWNWLIGGTDAHAKNYSLLLAGEQVRLAPLYDVASALPYGVHETKLRLAMKLGGDYRVDPYKDPWPATARELGLPPDEVLARVREVAAATPDAFADAAKSEDVTRLKRELPAALTDLVSDRAAGCLKTIGAATQQ